MKPLFLLFIIAITISVVRASEVEGLFIPVSEVEPKYGVDNGEIVMRFATERLELARVVFRYDTEDKKRYWLELDFTKWADPGDFYVFMIDGQRLAGFTVRGEGTNEGGGRWALGIADEDTGRMLLNKIAAAYGLPDAQILDRTKDE